MEQSMFIEWVKKNFGPVVTAYTETLNDTKNALTYRFLTMLTKEYSVTGKWESLSASNSLVAADIVAMDSPLPLKTRDVIARAAGEIPKMGMKLQLNERQLSDLDILKVQPGTQNQLLQKLFEDTPRVIGGIYERLEANLLEGLSTGVTMITDDENVGVGIRVDYGYKTANKFGVAALWSNPNTALPFDDFARIKAKVDLDGNATPILFMDQNTFNNLAKTQQARDMFAFAQLYNGSTTPTPPLSKVNEILQDRYGYTIEIVERSVRIQRDGGTPTSFKPWAAGQIAFLPGRNVGNLVWARLAEMSHPVAGVQYQIANDFILASKYRTNVPALGEWTSSQARALPVITNVDSIYILDTLTVQA